VTAVVSARGKEVARQIGASEVLVASIDLDMEIRSRPRYDVVFNTVGPSLNVLCQRAVDPDGKVICTAHATIPADSYGFIFGFFYALWARVKCLLQVINFFCMMDYIKTCVNAGPELTYKVMETCE